MFKKSYILTLTFLTTMLLLLSNSIKTAQAETLTDNLTYTDYYFTYYDTNNGFPSSEANCILQSKKGNIWIGTNVGLIHYNGKDFFNYSSLEGNNNITDIKALYEDKNNTLYVGTNNQGIFVYKNGIFTSVENSQQSSIRAFYELENQLFTATSKGLFKIIDDKLESVTPQTDISLVSITSDSYGNLWSIDNKGKVYYCINNTLVQLTTISDATNITRTKNEEIIITSGSIIYTIKLVDNLYNNTSLHITSYSTEYAYINSVFVGNNNSIWLLGDKGISQLNDSQIILISALSIEKNKDAKDMMVDYEGNLWFVTAKSGIIKFVQTKVHNYSNVLKLDNSNVFSTYYDGENILAGTDDGLVVFDSQNKIITTSLSEMLINTKVTVIIGDDNNNMYMSITKNGHNAILKYNINDGEYYQYIGSSRPLDNIYNLIEGMPDSSVTAMYSDNEKLYFGTQEGDFGYIDQNGIHLLPSFSSSVTCFAKFNDNLYIGTNNNGLYSYKDTVQGIDSKNRPLINISSLATDIDNNCLWISSGSYLGKLHTTDNIDVTSTNYLSAGNILNLILHNDNLWLVKSNSIISLDSKKLVDGVIDYTLIDKNDGINYNFVENATVCVDNDDYYYIPTNNGLISVKSIESKINNIAIKTVINYIEIDGKIYYDYDNLVVPSNAVRITIYFNANTFSDKKYTIHYYLDGLESAVNTMQSDATHSVTYTNLKGGNYTFHLWTVNDSNVRNEQDLTISFSKHKGLLEQWYVILAIALGSAILLAILYSIIYKKRMKKSIEIQNSYKAISREAFQSFANTIDAKDPYTNGHSKRVAMYSVELAKALGFSEEELEHVYYIGLLHDIGKIGIPDNILNKPSKLSDNEFEIIKTHVMTGGYILKDFSLIPNIADGAKYHHERYDGKGYVNKISGEDIPLIARIICVADSFDAMSSARVYRPNMTMEKILEQLHKGRGTQFDPIICDIMINLINKGQIVIPPPPPQTNNEENTNG